MLLTLTEEQQDLRAGLRDYLRRTWTEQRLRELSDRAPLDASSWKELAALGIFDISPDGLSLCDAVVVFEELGRALVPGPLVATALAGALVPGAVDGSAVVAVYDTGAPPLVEHLPSATHLLVLGRGLSVLPAAQAASEPRRPLDPLTPVSWLTAPPVETDVNAEDSVAWRRKAVVLSAALQVGVAQGALDLATTYAKQRMQFDRQIGSFQSVKHLLAEMLVRVELGRSIVWAAASTTQLHEEGGAPGAADADRAVASAAILAADAATTNGRVGIQVHGGMGFTWEVLAHLYAKRAWTLAAAFGTVDGHEETVAGQLG
jgi:alkylation response protein AidB-like acyl-CoA dehydrogenase